MLKNPFTSKETREHSCYGKFDGKELQLIEIGTKALKKDKVIKVHDEFRAKILHRNPPFTCIGATSALNQNNYRFSMYSTMGTKETTLALARNLFTFVAEQDAMNSGFTAFIAVFENPIPQDEHEFEKLVWTQLQMLHDEDSRYHDWDPDFKDDINHKDFSYSFAQRCFFIIGLHPKSSRIARRFSYPVLVFNASRQFDYLIDTNQFYNFVKIVRERDMNLQGSINPNLPVNDPRFDRVTEAREYSGRAVEEDWQCPLIVHKKKP